MTRMHDSYTNLRQENAWCQQQQQHMLYLHDYRIYSINLPGRLLNFWSERLFKVGPYSRLGAY